MGGVAGEAGKRDGRAVDAGGEEAAEDDFVEGAVGAAWSFLFSLGFLSSFFTFHGVVGEMGGLDWEDDVRARKR